MQICRTVKEMRALVDEWRANNSKIALVPTMGYLHDGHISLVKIAHTLGDKVVLSLFVNPTQFGPTEDLDKYPRDFQRDVDACEKNGVDAIFAPTPDETSLAIYDCPAMPAGGAATISSAKETPSGPARSRLSPMAKALASSLAVTRARNAIARARCVLITIGCSRFPDL